MPCRSSKRIQCSNTQHLQELKAPSCSNTELIGGEGQGLEEWGRVGGAPHDNFTENQRKTGGGGGEG